MGSNEGETPSTPELRYVAQLGLEVLYEIPFDHLYTIYCVGRVYKG